MYAKREFNEGLRTYRRSANAKLKGLEKRLSETQDQLTLVSNVAHQKQTDGTAKTNPLIKMEDRHEAGLKKVVNINGEDRKTG